MNKKNLYFAALLMTAAMFTACSSDDNDSDGNGSDTTSPQVYTLTIEASKGSEYTRALAESGSTIKATWETTDNIEVYNSSNTNIATIKPAKGGSDISTILTGYINSGTSLSVGDELNLFYPNYNQYYFYLYQDGTLSSISNYYDYARATSIKVTKKSGNNYTAEPAHFANQQAVVKFTFKKSNGEALNPTYLYIRGEKSGSERPVFVEWENALTGELNTNNIIMEDLTGNTNVIYAALRGLDSPGKVTLIATDKDDKRFACEQTNVTFEHGKFYRITVTMKTPDEISEEQGTGGVYGTMSASLPGEGDPDPDWDNDDWDDDLDAFKTLRGKQ